MLESFLSMLVGPGDNIWEHAAVSTKAAMNLGAGLETEVKGHIHSYLAWQKKPGLPFGTALTAHILNHNAEIAKTFVGWVKKVFE